MTTYTMFAAVAATSAHTLPGNGLPFNWVDAAILILIGFGVFRGRRNGMTRELGPTLQWAAIAIAAGLGYSPLADVFNNYCGLKSQLWCSLLAYFSITFVLFLIFMPIKKALKDRAEKGGLFGGSEYYLGMCSGPVRYASMIVVALALLNARSYTTAELAAKKAYNERWYGGGIYSGDYVPDLHTAQDAVFKESFSGPYLQEGLAPVLIQTGPGNGSAAAPQKPQPVIHMGK